MKKEKVSHREGSPSASSHKSKKLSRKAQITALIGVLAIGALAFFGFQLLSPQRIEASLKEGREFLKTQAEKSPDEVSAKIDERQKEEAARQLNETIAGINAGNVSIWPLFKDAVIIGDSRAAGFREYDYLPSSQVLAVIGSNINGIPKLEEQIGTIKPKTIYVAYGTNDVENQIGAANGAEEFGKLFEENLKKLLEQSPQSKIIVNSIMEVTPGVAASQPQWATLGDYNRQIQEMCQRNGWTYIDNSTLTEGGNAPIYEPDGIHFVSGFYETWGRNMLKSQYSSLAVN